MKSALHKGILTGGILNLLLALFHIFLCYQIYTVYGTAQVYPLLQLFAIGGMIMIFFLAYTSLFHTEELTTTHAGRSVLILNILVYFSRTLGEIILVPAPNAVIIVLCSFLTVLYLSIFIAGRKAQYALQSA